MFRKPKHNANTQAVLCAIALAACAIVFAPIGAFSKDCVPTESDSLGPFYISGMPVSSNLNRFGKKGTKLRVTGLIRSAGKGRAPIANARVEVWHADSEGDYHPDDEGKRRDYDDKKLDLRGTVVTDENGRYTYETIRPVEYGDRPAHFHYRITARGFRTLITQHYVLPGKDVPDRKCRSAKIVRDAKGAWFRAPVIYLRPR